ncbi:MAG: helix-turn-helix domain-containing protein [Olsenella sp.]|jgi:transcriptional regulator with XRE-family HTH domain|nr:helix-turn-helix domain-containing protein [Olsenella sp.]MCH3957426.1 helix-turn-helix domain-containing protein [Olsenella sp.]MCI1794302.1 helix-turn-helix domain-containing protein [Olsenella sp.]MCI1811770.1 helix-turn-helix domain-containing protein [Olsenella sp.]MCI1880359.1 helix-turn-helix domain-containing protein [Olsenella sp.]
MQLKLKDLRKQKKITQSALAKMMCVDTKTVGNWELGKTIMSAEQVWNCCEALHTDPNTLLGWYEEHPSDARDAPAILDSYAMLSDEGQEVATNVVSALVDKYPAGDGEAGMVEETA